MRCWDTNNEGHMSARRWTSLEKPIAYKIEIAQIYDNPYDRQLWHTTIKLIFKEDFTL